MVTSLMKYNKNPSNCNHTLIVLFLCPCFMSSEHLLLSPLDALLKSPTVSNKTCSDMIYVN